MGFVLTYIQSCASGKLPLADCGSAWQMLVIIVLLVLAVATLIALRFLPRGRAGAS